MSDDCLTIAGICLSKQNVKLVIIANTAQAGDRNIFKAYASHCRYRGKFHKGIHNRRLVELAALFTP